MWDKVNEKEMATCSTSSSEEGLHGAALESASNSSAFSTAWISEDQRPITYMIHPIIDEERLLDTLKRGRATFATMNKAMNDLRKIKGQPDFVLSPAEWDWFTAQQTWSQMRLTNDSSTTIVDSEISVVTNPLHRCNGKTNVAFTTPLPGALDDGAKGDGRCSCHGDIVCLLDGKDEGSVVSTGSSSNATSILSSEKASSDKQLSRKSSMRRILRRVSGIFRRRSELSASVTNAH